MLPRLWLSFVCDWLILSAGDTVAVLPQSVAVVCLPTARGGCYWSADGAHNSITSARSSASCLTLFHSSLPVPYSASLFPSFHPSFLSLPHFPPLSTSSSLLPHVFVSRVHLCAEPSVRLSVRCGRRMRLLREGWDRGEGEWEALKRKKEKPV